MRIVYRRSVYVYIVPLWPIGTIKRIQYLFLVSRKNITNSDIIPSIMRPKKEKHTQSSIYHVRKYNPKIYSIEKSSDKIPNIN